jgi:hypothetical protein
MFVYIYFLCFQLSLFLFSVEWSCYEDFLPLTGEAIVDDLRHLEYEMRGLTKGCRYYVRVSACNVKGYGGVTLASPPYAVPSSKFTVVRFCLFGWCVLCVCVCFKLFYVFSKDVTLATIQFLALVFTLIPRL